LYDQSRPPPRSFFVFTTEKRQVLTEQQRRQCMQFARDFRTGKLPLVNLIFCDESKFAMGPDNHWVWRRGGEYSEGVFAETNKYTKISIHAWAAIGSGFKFPLIIFTKNVDLTHYIDSLQKVDSWNRQMANSDRDNGLWFRTVYLVTLVFGH
jgi:hypothetical protein